MFKRGPIKFLFRGFVVVFGSNTVWLNYVFVQGNPNFLVYKFVDELQTHSKYFLGR